MADRLNPGVDPPQRGRLRDPARAIGDNRNAIDSTTNRVKSIERLLQNYREKQVQVRRDDGSFQTITVLAKEGGSADSSDYPSTLVPKTIYQKEGVWRLVFHPAMFREFSLKETGKAHKIKADTSTLDAEELPEIPLSGITQKVWLKFGLTPGCTVEADSPEVVVGDEPPRKLMQPKRPDGGNVAGKYVQHVGTVKFVEGGEPEWVPGNSDASVSIFLPAIECIGDGIRDYDTYQADPPTDKFRTFRGQNDDELDDTGWNNLEKEFGSDSGFQIRLLPIKIVVDLNANTLILKGVVKVPIPTGAPGSRVWKDCEGNEVMRVDWKRGLIRSTGDEEMEAGCDGTGNSNSV